MEPRNESEEWELDEGIPQLEDQFIQQYLRGRQALIDEENKRQHDAGFRQTLSPAAEEACRIVARVRERELKEVWQSDVEAASCDQDQMEETDLWRIMRRMPKGALLHGNLGTLVNLNVLVDQALDLPRLHIASITPLATDVERRTSPIHFYHLPTSPAGLEAFPDLWDANYKPMTFLPVKQVAKTFPDSGLEGFRAWLKSRCSIVPEVVSDRSCGAEGRRRPVQRAFHVIDPILYYKPAFQRCLRLVLSEIHNDGIMYAEFRVAFDSDYGRDMPDMVRPYYSTFFQTFGEEVESYKSSIAGTGFMGARVIWTVSRSQSNYQIVESMKLCIDAKKEFPEFIAGFDLTGHEKEARPLAELVPILFWFKKRCVEEDVEIPYLFQAGECVGDSADIDQNLYDAMLLGSRRICNGFSLYKHPLLIEHLNKKKILVEWNEPPHLNTSIMSHPLPALLSRGVAVSLCGASASTDHVRSIGLTKNFCWALNALQTMGLSGLATMAENSIRWSCFDDQATTEWVKGITEGMAGAGVKATSLKVWYAAFESFCQWVVLEFGTGEEGEEEEGGAEQEEPSTDAL